VGAARNVGLVRFGAAAVPKGYLRYPILYNNRYLNQSVWSTSSVTVTVARRRCFPSYHHEVDIRAEMLQYHSLTSASSRLAYHGKESKIAQSMEGQLSFPCLHSSRSQRLLSLVLLIFTRLSLCLSSLLPDIPFASATRRELQECSSKSYKKQSKFGHGHVQPVTAVARQKRKIIRNKTDDTYAICHSMFASLLEIPFNSPSPAE
jgi:hypothetical protein